MYIISFDFWKNFSIFFPGKINHIDRNIEWKKLDDYQVPQLIIQQKEYRLLESEEPGFSQVRGVLVNKSSFDFDKIDIDVLIFNSSGQIIGLSTTELRTLLSGQERDFFTTWFNQIKGEVISVQIEPETNLFDSDNYLTTGQKIPEVLKVPEKFQ